MQYRGTFIFLILTLALSPLAAAKELANISIRESDALIGKIFKKKVVYDEKLAKLGVKLARASHTERNFRYNFKVIESNKINAISLGNGSIYVHRGLLNHYKDNNQQLAFVLAHEIAHTMLRHYDSKRYLKKAGKEFKGIMSELKEKKNDQKTDEAVKSAKRIIQMLKNGFERQQEYDADRWAMFYLTRIGYSAMVGVRALQKLKEASNFSPDKELLSNHPTGSNRITHAFRVMAEISQAIANYEHGEIYLADGKFESAAEAFDEFLRTFPDSPEGYANLGLAYTLLATSSVDKSDFFLDASIAKLEADYFLRGSGSINEQYYHQALEAFNQALSLKPDFAIALSSLGALEVRAQNYEAAKPVLEKALSLDKDNTEYHNNLGVYLAKVGQDDSALDHFRKAIELV